MVRSCGEYSIRDHANSAGTGVPARQEDFSGKFGEMPVDKWIKLQADQELLDCRFTQHSKLGQKPPKWEWKEFAENGQSKVRYTHKDMHHWSPDG
jgi:hypothetical protein